MLLISPQKTKANVNVLEFKYEKDMVQTRKKAGSFFVYTVTTVLEV